MWMVKVIDVFSESVSTVESITGVIAQFMLAEENVRTSYQE